MKKSGLLVHGLGYVTFRSKGRIYVSDVKKIDTVTKLVFCCDMVSERGVNKNFPGLKKMSTSKIKSNFLKVFFGNSFNDL